VIWIFWRNKIQIFQQFYATWLVSMVSALSQIQQTLHLVIRVRTFLLFNVQFWDFDFYTEFKKIEIKILQTITTFVLTIFLIESNLSQCCQVLGRLLRLFNENLPLFGENSPLFQIFVKFCYFSANLGLFV
jgi:hypothetical protein